MHIIQDGRATVFHYVNGEKKHLGELYEGAPIELARLARGQRSRALTEAGPAGLVTLTISSGDVTELGIRDILLPWAGVGSDASSMSSSDEEIEESETESSSESD